MGNSYFKLLLSSDWSKTRVVGSLDQAEWESVDQPGVYMMESDMVHLWDPVFLAIVEEYAADNTVFLEEFQDAWTRMMNAGRFSGPTRNVCDEDDATLYVITSAQQDA